VERLVRDVSGREQIQGSTSALGNLTVKALRLLRSLPADCGWQAVMRRHGHGMLRQSQRAEPGICRSPRAKVVSKAA
jgi:hypothetical protein